MAKAAGVLKDFGVSYSAHVISAHRTPELLDRTMQELNGNGTEVIIAGAGLSAALPGALAAKTLLPVIGVPISGGALNGLDALYAIVQMPKPLPVATVGIDNAANAAWLALEILAVKHDDIRKKLADYRAKMKAEFEQTNKDVTL
jgi:5-(carboxyamino)imidazole ribonucleotide mutase